MATAVILRPMTLNDIPASVEIEQKTQPHAWTAAQFEEALAQHLCLGLESEGQLNSYAIIQTVLDEAGLLSLSTRPSAQKQGFARQLLYFVQTELAARGIRCLQLEVRASNIGAQAFYKKMGFFESGRRPRYYPPLSPQGSREDAFLMDWIWTIT